MQDVVLVSLLLTNSRDTAKRLKIRILKTGDKTLVDEEIIKNYNFYSDSYNSFPSTSF